eukprot:Nitzschia sp. Nitz4//scaffold81_size91200//22870//24707//NITZ4_004980-RA/size91200-snap-gene-0.29-mRNA-1//-1//CDS//3329558692//6179//frame0
MASTSDDDTETMENHNISGQSRMISSAMKQADFATAQVDYGVPGAQYQTNNNAYTVPPGSVRVNHNPGNTTSVSGSHGSKSNSSQLELIKNDAQFHVIANLIVTRYKETLDSGAPAIVVTVNDKLQWDRIASKDSFVKALRVRMQSLPSHSQAPIHVICRQCHKLGLHRTGDQNPLYAAAGTTILLEKSTLTATQNTSVGGSVEAHHPQGQDTSESLARQQLLAELKEASNLMAESVTPEAAQFWRNHVVELQTRLRALHEGSVPVSTDLGGASSPASAVSGGVAGIEGTQSLLSPAASQAASEPATNEMDPQVQGLPMVDVVAPSTLPEGYTFEAEIDNKRFLATVPAGGVRKGQTFTCYMRDVDKIDSDIPVGRWRDELFDCFKHGVFHPMLLNSIFCPLVALGQILTRMGLDFTGQPPEGFLPRHGLWSTRGTIACIVGFWIALNVIVFLGFRVKYTEGVPISGGDVASIVLINGGMFAYVVYAVSNARSHIRNKYLIREKGCRDLEDILLAGAAMPCTLAQMGRHTAQYDDYEAVCCNDTGLPEGVESDITSRTHTGSYRLW